MAISSKSGLPARKIEEAFAAARSLPDNKSEAMLALLSRMDSGFWQKLRKIQIVTLFPGLRGTCLSYRDISKVMDVSKGLVSRIKRYYEEHPEKVFRDPGRPSLIGDVFGQIKNFIQTEIDEERSVTISILLAYLSDVLGVYVSRKNLREFMRNHGYSYVSAVPTEEARVNVDRQKLNRFYTTRLPAALEGVHPSLVFNMDEMGAERYADRKRVKVFMPERLNRGSGMEVGVPRTTHRCTLIGCIALDGSRLRPAVITRNLTVSSLVFESGYSLENFTLYSTKSSFINSDVFERWLVDIFIPYVEEKRESLRKQLGDFDDRAVLILDGCSSHKNEAHKRLLAEKTSRCCFWYHIPHTSRSPSTWAFLDKSRMPSETRRPTS